jgi:hypothetical protein
MPPLIPIYECDLVDAESGERLHAVTLPLVPRTGEVVHFGSQAAHGDGRAYRVVEVQYAVAAQQRVRLGHLDRIVIRLTAVS